MRRLRVVAALFVVWVLQVSLFAHLRPFDVAPDLLLVAALVGGLVGGPDFGAKHGFAAGLLLDLVTPGPFGLAAGIYGFFGNAIGSASRSVDSDDPRVLPILIFGFSFVAMLVYGLGLGVLGSEQFVDRRLLWVALMVAVYSIPLVLPVRSLLGWAVTGPHDGARTETSAGVVN